MREIYLDNSATTRVFPEVAELMTRIYTEEYGNPSSLHHKGVEAERELTKAKQTLAGILKCEPGQLYFTSCGTESDNLAILGAAAAHGRRGKHIITTPFEHPAVSECMKYLESQGYEITTLKVDGKGMINPEDVAEAVREDTILVSVMHTNNEIGSVQQVGEIGRLIKEKNRNTLFHVDAVQGFGKAVLHPSRMHIDLLAASGHKIHAPKGIGLLYVGKGVRIRSTIYGGGQQGGMRSGTENVAGIAGMALAADMLYRDLEEERAKLFRMKKSFAEKIASLPDVQLNGPQDEVSGAPNVISLSVKNVRAEVLLHALEDRGIYVSSGSACSSNRPHTSSTLTAIGLPKEYLDSTIRISTSVMNTEEDIDDTVRALQELVPVLRKYTAH